MSEAPSSEQPADNIHSRPESQHGKHICDAVLTRPSGELHSFLKQAATDLSEWGRAAAASFLHEPMPLLEESVDLHSSVHHRIIEQNPVSITPLYLRAFDMHASKQAETPFLKAKVITNCALATGVEPNLPYKVELGLEEAPPKPNAQPFVSSSKPRRAPQGPSINDTFSLGRKPMGPHLHRDANKPVVTRNSLPLFAAGRRNSVATRNMSRMRINGENSAGVEDNQSEDNGPQRPEGLTDEQWKIQKDKLLRKNDLDKVINKIHKIKRLEEYRDQERHRSIEDTTQEEIVPANDTFYERTKKRQERERKKQEQAEEALRRKRARLENKKKRNEKRRKGPIQKGRDAGSGEEEIDQANSGEERNNTSRAAHIQDETEKNSSAPGTEHERERPQDAANHTNIDHRQQSEHVQPRFEERSGRHQYDYHSHPTDGRPHSNHSLYGPHQGYPSASYSSRLNDRQMFDDRNSYHRPHYPPGPERSERQRHYPYEDSRPHLDVPVAHPFHPGRETIFRGYREDYYPPNPPPQRFYENGGDMPSYRPPPHPMDMPLAPPNDAEFRSPLPPPADYRRPPPPRYMNSSNYYHPQNQQLFRSHPERDYTLGPNRMNIPDRMTNPNSPPPRYPHAAPFRP